MFNMEEEVCLNITINHLEMKKEEEEMSRLLILNIGRKTQSDPHLDFSCFVCFGVAWKNIEVFYASNILFFLSSFASTRPSTLSAWRKYLNF